MAAQIAGAQAQLRQSEINLGYTEIRAPIDGTITSTAVTEGNVVSPTSGTLATLVSQDPMYVIFSISQRTGLDLRDRYGAKGGFSAVVIKVRLPDGRIYGEDGKLDYASPTVSENTDTITLRGVIPNTVFPGHESRNARFAPIDGRGIRDRAARRRATDFCSRHPARCGAVRSARRLRVRCRRAEQSRNSAHPARSVDPFHGRCDQWAGRKENWSSAKDCSGYAPTRPCRLARRARRRRSRPRLRGVARAALRPAPTRRRAE